MYGSDYFAENYLPSLNYLESSFYTISLIKALYNKRFTLSEVIFIPNMNLSSILM